MFSKEQINRKFELQLQEKKDQIESISALCTKYDVGRIKNKLVTKIFDKLRELQQETGPQVALVEEGEEYLRAAALDHFNCVQTEKEAVVPLALQVYKSHLNQIITADILALQTK